MPRASVSTTAPRTPDPHNAARSGLGGQWRRSSTSISSSLCAGKAWCLPASRRRRANFMPIMRYSTMIGAAHAVTTADGVQRRQQLDRTERLAVDADRCTRIRTRSPHPHSRQARRPDRCVSMNRSFGGGLIGILEPRLVGDVPDVAIGASILVSVAAIGILRLALIRWRPRGCGCPTRARRDHRKLGERHVRQLEAHLVVALAVQPCASGRHRLAGDLHLPARDQRPSRGGAQQYLRLYTAPARSVGKMNRARTPRADPARSTPPPTEASAFSARRELPRPGRYRRPRR